MSIHPHRMMTSSLFISTGFVKCLSDTFRRSLRLRSDCLQNLNASTKSFCFHWAVGIVKLLDDEI